MSTTVDTITTGNVRFGFATFAPRKPARRSQEKFQLRSHESSSVAGEGVTQKKPPTERTAPKRQAGSQEVPVYSKPQVAHTSTDEYSGRSHVPCNTRV
jgi:hypothetical protein